jgi:antitoxin Phd
MVMATATEVKNRFGEYMEKAQKEPVTVEKTGRPYVVLLSQEEYERLQRLEDALWGQRAEAVRQRGDYLGPEETLAAIRARLDAIERGEE